MQTTEEFKIYLERRGFTFQANGTGLYVLPTADLTPEEIARIKADKDDLLWLLLPSLTADGSLLVPRGTDKRNQYWRDGSRTLWDLLAELNAPAATIRRYTGLVEKLHGGLQQCKGRVVDLPELSYCIACGWREEVATESELQAILGF
jgi:hypothetical protein